ncbi:MAG: biotin-dependent carboxyltransferase [Planctomycetes bacterium]|nr:biotin-dependent carboxyltransferase [Planctomycetota bacterium]
MSLRVLEPGLCSLLVDQGRLGHRNLGVPLGGAADRWSLTLGNALVGNLPDALALEISLAGPSLRAEGQVACVLCGAPFSMMCNDRYRVVGTTFTLQAGDELTIGGTTTGMRAYLCVRGGFTAPAILGSRSSLEPIRAGAELPCLAGRIHGRFLRDLPFASPTVLRVLPGLQADWFDMAEFLLQEYTVTPASNRMGLRLDATPLTFNDPGREMSSEPVSPGAVQVTRDGRCILLGVDGQTIGGYPKIAHVIQADLDAVGQLRPGDHFRFVRVDLAEARRAYLKRCADLDDWVKRLRTSLEGWRGLSPVNM